MVELQELKEQTEELAQKAGLTPEDFEALLSKCRDEALMILKKEITEEDEASMKWMYKRAQLALKMKFATGKADSEGYIMTWGRLVDFTANPRAERAKP